MNMLSGRAELDEEEPSIVCGNGWRAVDRREIRKGDGMLSSSVRGWEWYPA